MGTLKQWLWIVGLAALLWATPRPAVALTDIRLTDLHYEACPPELAAGAVTSGGTTHPAQCFLITGKANNPTAKPVYDADVYGRVFDANGEPAIPNRGRLDSLEVVPPGVSDFVIRITVPATQPPPLTLAQFKASGFSSRVRR